MPNVPMTRPQEVLAEHKPDPNNPTTGLNPGHTLARTRRLTDPCRI